MVRRSLFYVSALLASLSLTACGGGGSSGGGSIPAPVISAPVTTPTANPGAPSPTPSAKAGSPTPTPKPGSPTPKPVTPSPTPAPTTGPTTLPSTAPSVIFGIDAGSTNQVGSYQPDTDYNGGTTTTTSATINTSKVSNPAPQAVYQTQRSATDLTYTIPSLTPSTAYAIRLHFVESTYTAVGKRVFTISVNGSQVLANYDIFAAAGGANIANIQSFTANSNAAGQLIIDMKASVGSASLAALDLAIPPSPPAGPTTGTQSICVKGNEYKTVEDDEFDTDLKLNLTANATPAAGQWSDQFFYSARTENSGTDDVFYTDPSIGPFYYNPFSLVTDSTGHRSLHITAIPVPTQYADAPILSADGTKRHWLSGTIQGVPQTYGYVEASLEEPTEQGTWPGALWLETTKNSNGQPPNLEELDANEMYGNFQTGCCTPHYTIHYGYNDSIAGESQGQFVTMSTSAETNFHTYGILWTPTTVTFYVDRVAQATYPGTSTGPMVPIVNLQMYLQNTGNQYQPPPALVPESINLQYFRWYQDTSAPCLPSAVN